MTRPTTAAVRRPAPPARPRHRLAALAAAALVLLAPVALAAPASAHDSLTGSTPADGSTVTTAPERVRLTFTDEVKDLGLTVLVKDPSGASVADGKPRIDGNAVIQPVVPLTEPGIYTVSYRVVSTDGHPVNGRFTFTLDVAAASPSPSASSTATASPSQSPTESASTSTSPTASSSSIAASPAASTSDSGSATTWLLVGAGLLVALVVTGVVLARRRSA